LIENSHSCHVFFIPFFKFQLFLFRQLPSKAVFVNCIFIEYW
jgi:hypothetical protein